MNRILIFAFVMFSFFQTNAQTNSKAYKMMLEGMYKHSVPTISCQELKKEQRNVILLDTRAQREYEVSHLPKARWVGYEGFDVKTISDLPKDAAIVVYCTVGVRSEKIGEKLKAAGYQNVRNLYGSIFEWVNQGNTVEDNQGQPTPKVHAYSRTWGGWLNKGEKIYE